MYYWKKTHESIITLFMANIAQNILIAQIWTDFVTGKIGHAQENYCQIAFIQVKIANNIPNKTYRSTGYEEGTLIFIELYTL